MNTHLPVIYAESIILLSSLLLILKITNITNSLKWLSKAVMLFTILFFYIIIYTHTDNIPFQDDWVLLESLYKMKVATTFIEFCKAFFQQVNQHRFGFERIIFVLINDFWGSENIKAQIILGDSFLIGLLLLLFNFFKKVNLSIVYFTPIPLLLFNLTYYENANWGIAAIQNTPIIFFAFLTIYLLCKSNLLTFYFAIITAIITMFTSGNGLSIWVIGFIILVVQNRKKQLLIWLFFTFALLIFYFSFDYTFISSDRTNLIKHPILNIVFILTFFGNIFFQNIPHPYVIQVYEDVIACIVFGCFLMSIIFGGMWKLYKELKIKVNPLTLQLLGWLAFLALTGLMLMLSRPVEIKTYHGGETLSRRYMIFGAAFACVGYLGYLFLLKQKKQILEYGFYGFLIMGTFININSYYTSIPSISRQQQELRLDAHFWKKDTMLLSFGEKYKEKLGYNHPTYFINLVKNLESSGLYTLSDEKTKPIYRSLNKVIIQNCEYFKGKVDTTMSIGVAISLEKRPRVAFKGNSFNKDDRIKYFGLKSKKDTFIFPAIREPNSIHDCLISQSFYGSKFNYDIWQAKIPSGDYEIWVIEEDNGRFNPKFSSKMIHL